MVSELSILCVSLASSLRQAVTQIDRNETGIVLITDEDGKLLGTVTDGDVRRAILAGRSLSTPVKELLTHKDSFYIEPVTAPIGTERSVLLQLMQERVVRQVPLLDSQGRVAALVTLDELLPDQVPSLQAVIMAGGFGTRLHPLTENVPKPMLPIGERPLMELIIEQLQHAGIRRVNIATHYLSEKIVDHFGNGQIFGVDLTYVNEDPPLGTAGALGLMVAPNEPLLVINRDILTRVDFRALLSFHREHRADLTIAVRQYDVQVPYGVIECDGARVNRVNEKPLVKFLVNAGIYLLEPSVHTYIPKGRHFNMTDLIQCLIAEGRPVVSFPIVEYWLDVGQHADYEQAQGYYDSERVSTSRT
jgi:dTDP-glucose pyrophosphorylase/CBS domain-containing protein